MKFLNYRLKRLFFSLAIVFSVVLPQTSFAQGVGIEITDGTTTPGLKLSAVTGALSCFRYFEPAGICVYVNPFTGSVDLEDEVTQYHPALTTFVYNHPGSIPLLDFGQAIGQIVLNLLKTILKAALSAVQFVGGGSSDEFDARSPNVYKEVTTIGNPGYGDVLDLMDKSGQLQICAKVAKEFDNYFQSELDALQWRAILPDPTGVPLDSAIPGPGGSLTRRVVGTPLDNWGDMEPFFGMSSTTNPGQASALKVQQVSYLLTHGTSGARANGHVMTKIRRACGGPGCRLNGPLEENTDLNGMHQPVHPLPIPKCGTIGPDSATHELNWREIFPSQNKVYNAWTCVRCCRPGNGILVAIIPVAPGCNTIPNPD